MGFGQSFWAGVNDSRASRAEMANSFAQFRAQNPHASLPEMQSFIDQLAGGNNYLRGGMPSGSVLQGIAQQNQQAAAYERSMNAQKMMQQQLATQGMLQTAAEQALVAANGDLGQAAQILQGNFGGNLQGLPIQGLITEDNWNRIQTNMLMDTYPKAQSLLSGMMTDGNKPSMKDLKRMFPGMPDSVLSQMADRAMADFENETATRKSELRSRIIGNNQAILGQVKDIVAGNPDVPYDRVRDEIVNWLGMTDNPEDYPDDIIQGFYDKAQNEYKQDLEREQAAIEAETNTKLADAYQKIVSDPALQTFLLGESPDRDAKATAHIERMLAGVGMDNVPEGWVNDVLQSSKQLLAEQMRIRQGEAAAAGAAELATLPNTLRSENNDAAQDALTRYQLPDVSRPTWEALAQEYYVSPQMGEAFLAAWNSLSKSEKQDPDIVRASAEAEFAARGIQKLDAVIGKRRDEYEDSIGAREIVTFDEYLTDLTGDLNESVSAVQDRLDTILQDPDIGSRVARLQTLKEGVANSAELAAGFIQDDAMDRHRWLDPRTRWDDDEISLQVEAYGRKVIGYMSKIDQLIEKAAEEHEAAGAAIATEVGAATTPSGKPLSTEDTPATLFVKDVGEAISAGWDKIEFNQTWVTLQNDLLKENSFGVFRYSEAEVDARRWVTRLMNSGSIKAYFAANSPEELKAFYADPITYARKHSDDPAFGALLAKDSWPGPAPGFDWTKRTQ